MKAVILRSIPGRKPDEQDVAAYNIGILIEATRIFPSDMRIQRFIRQSSRAFIVKTGISLRQRPFRVMP